MSFAILRTAKLKSMGEIGGSLSHNYRDRPTPNANPRQTPNNEHSLPNAELVMTAIKDKIPEKRRKDAVLCVEYLITASPDWIGWNQSDEQKYFDDAKKWLEDRHGKDNVIATTIHRDESTPHMIAYVVPLVDRKLNAKKFLGGREKLSKMQTDFADNVGKSVGLVRGLEGSKAEHQTIKQYYTNVNTAVKISPDVVLDVPEKRLLESKESYENRVFEVLDQEVSPILNRTASLQNELKNVKRENSWLRAEMSVLRMDVKSYQDATRHLKKEDRASIDQAVFESSQRFFRQYEFERQLEYSRLMSKREQEKADKKQQREEQERIKRIERIEKEEQKLQKEEQPKPQKEEQPKPQKEEQPQPQKEEQPQPPTPQIQEQSPKPTNTRGVRP